MRTFSGKLHNLLLLTLLILVFFLLLLNCCAKRQMIIWSAAFLDFVSAEAQM